MHRGPTATKENRRWKGHRSPHKERKTKENKRNRIRQDPSTPSSSYSPTDLERLDANVSSRDGLRKPLLTSYRHKCLLPESPHDEEQREKKKKKKKKKNKGGTASMRTLGTGGSPHTVTGNTLPEPPPIPSHHSIPRLSEGVLPQANTLRPLTPNLTTFS